MRLLLAADNNPLQALLRIIQALFRTMADHPWLTFLLLLNAYFLLLYVLVKKGWLARFHMSLFGPALMIKTERGRGILDFFARARRFFDWTAAIGMRATFLMMALMSLLLLVQLWFVFRIPPEAAPSPRLILGIPGINPLIPLGYGVLALIVAVVVHEFGHGILARVHRLRVKTMGILILIIPIGAFVEPDEDELRSAPRRQRQKVFAAGPTMNLAFALLFAFLFSPLLMGQASAIPGAPVRSVEADGPAGAAGIQPGWVITHVNETRVANRDDFVTVVNRTPPGALLTLGLREPGRGDERRTDVVTRRCIDQYGASECWTSGNLSGHSDPLNRTVIGISIYDADHVRSALANPFGTWRHPGSLDSWRGILFYISLPFEALQGQFPLVGPFQGFYETPFHAGTFWALANAFYWLFWINLMLGLTNALPILPLDGGYMFRDWIESLVQRRSPRMSPERRARIAQRLSLAVALFLVALVLLQFVGPRLAGLF